MERLRLFHDFNDPKLVGVVSLGDDVTLFDGEGNEVDAKITGVRLCNGAPACIVFECSAVGPWRQAGVEDD